MSTNIPAPTLHFFRRLGEDVSATPPLASSLQSLETCFILISMKRFPHALLTCAAAIESAIKAKLKLSPDDETPLRALIEDIRNRSHNLRLFDTRKLTDFRQTRNRIVHYGFIPADNDKSTRLLLQTGLPFLRKCYFELFGFFLDWREIRAGLTAFDELSDEEKKLVWLNPGVADQLRVASDVYSKAKELHGIDLSYCVESFAHFIRMWLRQEVISSTRTYPLLKDRINPQPDYSNMYTDFDRDGYGYENDYWSERIEATKREYEKEFELPWFFDCPICGGSDTVVGDLDDPSFDRGKVVVSRAVCASCGLIVAKDWPYLAERLFEAQCPGKKSAIFKELGLSISGDSDGDL